jgi:hypothetical protein
VAAFNAAFNMNDPEARKNLRAMFGPDTVDTHMRQAFHFCWMILPDDKRTVEELEKQMRRIFERIIEDLREDAQAFGLGKLEP